MTQSLWGVLTLIAFAAVLFFAACAFVLVRRLLRRPPTPLSEEVGSVGNVLRKVRKGEPMSAEEVEYATQVITDRRSFLASRFPPPFSPSDASMCSAALNNYMVARRPYERSSG